MIFPTYNHTREDSPRVPCPECWRAVRNDALFDVLFGPVLFLCGVVSILLPAREAVFGLHWPTFVYVVKNVCGGYLTLSGLDRVRRGARRLIRRNGI